MITINRASAESIVLDRLREERDARLAALDIRYMRATEAGEDTAGIVAEKQALRDVPEKDLSKLSIDKLAVLTLDQALALKSAAK